MGFPQRWLEHSGELVHRAVGIVVARGSQQRRAPGLDGQSKDEVYLARRQVAGQVEDNQPQVPKSRGRSGGDCFRCGLHQVLIVVPAVISAVTELAIQPDDLPAGAAGTVGWVKDRLFQFPQHCAGNLAQLPERLADAALRGAVFLDLSQRLLRRLQCPPNSHGFENRGQWPAPGLGHRCPAQQFRQHGEQDEAHVGKPAASQFLPQAQVGVLRRADHRDRRENAAIMLRFPHHPPQGFPEFWRLAVYYQASRVHRLVAHAHNIPHTGMDLTLQSQGPQD